MFRGKNPLKPKFERVVEFELLEEFRDYTAEALEIFIKESKFRSTCQPKVLRYLINNNISEIRASELMKNTRSALSVLKSLEKREFLKLKQVQVNRASDQDFSPDKQF